MSTIDPLILSYSAMFDDLLQLAHDEKLFEDRLRLLENDYLKVMCLELVAIANDARYHFIQLMVLNAGVEGQKLGDKAFTRSGENWDNAQGKRNEWPKE